MTAKPITLNPEPIASQLAEVSKDVEKAQRKQKKVIVITNETELNSATEFLAQVKGKLKSTEELRTTFTKPLNAYLKMVNDMFKEQTGPMQEIEKTVKRAISDFVLHQEEIAAKEETRLQALQDKKNERRAEKGKELDFTDVSIDRVDSTTNVKSGKAKNIKVWKFEVVDASKVPMEYCSPDEHKIREAVKNQEVREIEGVRIYEDVQVNITPF